VLRKSPYVNALSARIGFAPKQFFCMRKRINIVLHFDDEKGYRRLALMPSRAAEPGQSSFLVNEFRGLSLVSSNS